MKRITASLIIACLLLGVTSFGQQITFSNKRATLKDISKALEKQAGYTIVADTKAAPLLKPVSIDVKKVSVEEFLNAYFRDQPFRFKIFGQIVTLVARERAVMATPLVTIRGKILNEQGEPIPAATVTVNGSNKVAVTNDNGEFTLSGVDTNFNIVISSINYEPQEIDWQGEQEMDIRLKHRISELNIVSVVSDGYQKQTKEKATGSYAKIDNELLNRRVSTNIIDRLEGITSGLVFNKNVEANTNQSQISIRSRSTIFANPNPLIVLDNFPYTGDINNINPNDVESITVLKDADAALIWGAYSGNGVIVITTKKGKYQSPLKVSFNSNVTVGSKPDLYYQPIMSSAQYIEAEKEFFARDDYRTNENLYNRPVLSPVVEILIRQREGLITATEADKQIAALTNLDKRIDIEKYFYRHSVNQQYAVNANGGSANNHYYFSAGYDKNLSDLKRNQFDRITLTANNTFSWLKKRLEFNTGIIFTESNTANNSTGFSSVRYPYSRLVGDDGKPLAVPVGFRDSYKDTAGRNILQRWDYVPLEELGYADNTTKNSDYRINLDIKLKVMKGIDLTSFYQFNRGYVKSENFQDKETYYVRNLSNLFTTIDSTGKPLRGIPPGGILDEVNSEYQAQNFRTQLNFNKSWYNRNHTKNHVITAMAGTEVRTVETQVDVLRLYGYNKDFQTKADVDYSKRYNKWDGLDAASGLELRDRNRQLKDNFLSYYATAKYIYDKKYILSFNARKDESNIFGVETNQKGVPLWSAGVSWELNQEKFYHFEWLPFLKLRTTYGYNGNVDKTVSAFTTAIMNGRNSYFAPIGVIDNPPNPSLRWEKNRMINFGIDFATRNAIIEGSVEYYLRKGMDLIGEIQLDPTTGFTSYTGNTSDMKGRGMDVAIRTKNLNKQLKWQTAILFSYATDEVTNYKLKQDQVWKYGDEHYMSPVEGRPLYSMYSFKFLGLDHLTGAPIGMLGNHPSFDYTTIVNTSKFDSLVYNGPMNPTIFGSLRNTFSWKNFEFSFTITYKLGYYFRRSSIHYSGLLNGSNFGHPDFENRWRIPGDELKTNVPALSYSQDQGADKFYQYSDILVEKGDHFRMQDLQLSYDLTKEKIRSLPMRYLRVYVYCNNIGLIWTANRHGVDPDYLSSYPTPRTFSVGVKTDL